MIPNFLSVDVWPVDEEEPYSVLPPGIHDTNLHEIKRALVDDFPHSTTRRKIYKGFCKLLEEAQRERLSMEHWVDGSYVTTKQSPDDIDAVTFLDPVALNSLSASGKNFVKQRLGGGESTKHTYQTHSFLELVLPEGHPLYALSPRRRANWIKEWGFTRPLKSDEDLTQTACGHPKGFLRFFSGHVQDYKDDK